jgi:ACS family pantothenate transporter-like MFS transporter
MLEAFAFQGMFLLWLKANKARFSQSAINTYPLGIQAVAIVSQVVAGVFIDRTGHRLPMVFFAGAMQLVTASLLLVRDLPDAGIFTAHYLSGTSFIVNPVMYGWASTICQRGGDDAVRGVTLYTMNTGGQVLYTWWGIVMYPATDAPYWKKGSITMLVVVFAFIGWSFIVRWVSIVLEMFDEMNANASSSSTEGHRSPSNARSWKKALSRSLSWMRRQRKADELACHDSSYFFRRWTPWRYWVLLYVSAI